MNRQSRLVKLPEQAIAEYLGGRPRDPRVTYSTGINKGKAYRTKEQAAAAIKAMMAKEVPQEVQVVDQAA